MNRKYTNHKRKIPTKIITISIIFLLISTFPVINAQLNIKLTVNTDQSQYYPGELVSISGRLTEDGSGMAGEGVCIEIKSPSGDTVHSICTLTNSQGGYNDFYTAEHGIGYFEITVHADIGATAYDSFNGMETGDAPKILKASEA